MRTFFTAFVLSLALGIFTATRVNAQQPATLTLEQADSIASVARLAHANEATLKEARIAALTREVETLRAKLAECKPDKPTAPLEGKQ